jgi:hypothetical protein
MGTALRTAREVLRPGASSEGSASSSGGTGGCAAASSLARKLSALVRPSSDRVSCGAAQNRLAVVSKAWMRLRGAAPAGCQQSRSQSSPHCKVCQRLPLPADLLCSCLWTCTCALGCAFETVTRVPQCPSAPTRACCLSLQSTASDARSSGSCLAEIDYQ